MKTLNMNWTKKRVIVVLLSTLLVFQSALAGTAPRKRNIRKGGKVGSMSKATKPRMSKTVASKAAKPAGSEAAKQIMGVELPPATIAQTLPETTPSAVEENKEQK